MNKKSLEVESYDECELIVSPYSSNYIMYVDGDYIVISKEELKIIE